MTCNYNTARFEQLVICVDRLKDHHVIGCQGGLHRVAVDTTAATAT
jgi:hypothetical protein